MPHRMRREPENVIGAGGAGPRMKLSGCTSTVDARTAFDSLAGLGRDRQNARRMPGHEARPQAVEEAVRGRHTIMPAASKRDVKNQKQPGKKPRERFPAVVPIFRRRRFRIVRVMTINPETGVEPPFSRDPSMKADPILRHCGTTFGLRVNQSRETPRVPERAAAPNRDFSIRQNHREVFSARAGLRALRNVARRLTPAW